MSSQSNANFLEGHILRRFTVIKKVGSGAYGHVWKVEEKATKKIYALKKIFDAFQHATDAQRTYRQIQILRQIDHPNIIKLYDTIRADNNKDVYLLFEYMEADLHNVIAEGILKDVHMKFIIYQMAKSLKYLHSGKIIHRDLKPSNVLVNSNCTIKLCDFGLVRSLTLKEFAAVLTEGVATRWYRSPEVLLGSKSYSTPADIWSFGCIIYEIIAQKPLFAGSCTMDQIQKICSFTGYPTEQDISSLESQISRSLIKEMKVPNSSNPSSYLKDFSPVFIDLLQKILLFNPKKRITIDEILEHEIVREFHKPEQEISCDKQISTSIDDNKKVTVDEYRRLVYGINTVEPKSKALSSSLGAGSVSPKYQPISVNKSTVTFSSSKIENRPEMVKKYSYDRVKPTSQMNYEQSMKKQQLERPLIKYVRSATNITKAENPSLLPQYQQKKEGMVNYDVPNREETDPNVNYIEHKQINFANYAPKYTYIPSNKPVEVMKSPQNMVPMTYSNNTPMNPNHFTPTSGIAWKSQKNPPSNVLTSNEIKEKVLQFRSAKYPIMQKINGQGQKSPLTTGFPEVGKAEQ